MPARPLCFEIIFSHKLAAGTCPNISFKNASEFGGRSNKSCSIASTTAHRSGVKVGCSGVGLAKFTTTAVRSL
ncbi:hypothetical protein K503DRAFT_773937 [Rhizopogon vinicolor AM-OR11-026]|uniref:Uncharacterized protein n=1 Tax=Rhizopogon vinicolor AM-OR11-026 TaxID=1314800 RepID=A0A1B7MQZ7_9AGAM|nr:hypothetical protein K503DRAFT_773937 [Rhizopogon vinicolor AM-OR11-026]